MKKKLKHLSRRGLSHGKVNHIYTYRQNERESLALLSCFLPQCPPLDFVNSRRLVVEQEDLPWRIIFSPQRLSTYVEFGAADIGIVGKDILLREKMKFTNY